MFITVIKYISDKIKKVKKNLKNFIKNDKKLFIIFINIKILFSFF